MENVIYLTNNLKIKKISFARLLTYFIIYSFLGYIAETFFGLFSKGVIESRQSFLFGPLCAIYGIGAILIILFLDPYKEKTWTVFFGSIVIGTISEYMMSYICEVLFNFKWWDYSDYLLNIHGRTCLFFALLWGISGLGVVKYFNPLLDKKLSECNKAMNNTSKKVITTITVILLILDIFITIVALKMFFKKVSNDYDINTNISKSYSTLEVTAKNYIDEDFILKVYPNMRVAGTEYNNVFIDNLYRGIKTYSYKFLISST